ncbi:DnaJ domain-containing protein, partial [Baffinella frigidus]
RCLYEILGIERDADADAIKAAYRKAALKWHPDKNHDRLEEATEVFKEITNAHVTLSDTTERAWYDAHRDQILRGGDGLGQESEEESIGINIFEFFSASCFKGFGDDEKGFFGVYAEVFNK